MNYYNPYYYMMNPMNGLYSTPSASRGLFSRLANGFNWSSLLNNTQRTLGIINQAIQSSHGIKTQFSPFFPAQFAKILIIDHIAHQLLIFTHFIPSNRTAPKATFLLWRQIIPKRLNHWIIDI